MSKRTPGRWKVGNWEGTSYEIVAESRPATVDVGTAYRRPDANLMAEAPALLSALREVFEVVNEEGVGMVARLGQASRTASRAIARVEGVPMA